MQARFGKVRLLLLVILVLAPLFLGAAFPIAVYNNAFRPMSLCFLRGRRTPIIKKTVVKATPSADIEAGNEMLQFLLWLQQNGADTGPLYIDNNCVGNTRGVKTAEYIGPQNTILSIPFKLCLTDSNNQFSQTPIGQAIEERAWKGLSSLAKLAAVLLYEKRKGTDSFYHPYIATLPEEPPSLLTRWSKKDLAELQDEFLVNKVVVPHSMKEESIFDELMKVIAENELKEDLVPKKKEFNWAIDMIRSRGFLLPDTEWNVLVPMMDMLNSDVRRHEVVFSFQRFPKSLILRTVSGIPPNYEVFNNYGEETNAYHLLNYGYIPEENPFECIKSRGLFSKKDLEDIDVQNTPDEKVALMTRLVEENEYFEIFPNQIQSSLIDGLRLLYATEDEHQSILNGTWSNAFHRGNNIISRGNENAIASALRQRCELLISHFPTALSEDMSLMKATQSLGGNGKLALEYRLYRKKVLNNLRESLSEYIFASNFQGNEQIVSLNQYLQDQSNSILENYYDDDYDDDDDDDDIFF